MGKTLTAREELAKIEKVFFKGAGLQKACSLEGEERRDYRLAQVERLLSDMRAGGPLAVYLSDRFWTSDEGRMPMPWENTAPIPEPGYLTNPLLSLEEQQTLTDKEMGRLRLILEIAGLCHDLSLYFTFDLKEAFGIKNDFWVSNKQLVEWLTSTKYEHIAMYTAYILKKHAISVYAYGHYQPAQDELAEIFSEEYGALLREPGFNKKVPPRAYAQALISTMLQIERHWQRGLKRKLDPELIMLHDEIYGLIPRQFDKGVLQAAQELYDYMDEQLCGRLSMIERRYHVNSFEELPEEGRHAANEAMSQFAERVRYVRDKYLAKGWIEDNSLAYLYLMDHAQRCGYGFWREEDDAL